MKPLKNYIIYLLSLRIKDILLYPANLLEKKGNNDIAFFVRNFRNTLRRQKHYFGFDTHKKLFYVIDDESKHYFGNRIRGFELYKNGLSDRAVSLANSYFLNKIEISKEDIIIDCGANYADLFLWLREKINSKNYITFEPGNEEFKTILENAPQSTNNNVGLGDENKTTTFYLNSQSADSSIIEPLSYTDTVEIKTITLSQYVNDNNIEKIKLFKLEAEGFEPEILEGSKDVIHLIEYIAIDGGYERGKLQEETFSYLTNFLLKNGFEMIGINLIGGRALFQRI